MKQRSPGIEFPKRRVVLLGASNLARSLPTVVRVAQRKWGAPLDLMAALGHGRSYGMPHRVLGRTLSGILDSGIWTALANRPPAETAALLTDIGNDIVFGASVDTISSWVEQCLERLHRIARQIIVTELPLPSIFLLSRPRFFFARQLLFPTSRMTLEEAIEKATQLNDRVIALTDAYGAQCAAHDPRWYGLDPIHVRRRSSESAWNSFLSHWKSDGNTDTNTHFSLYLKAQLRFARPERRWLMGIEQQNTQPALCLRDGTCVSLY